jgi:hypothetical protein
MKRSCPTLPTVRGKRNVAVAFPAETSMPDPVDALVIDLLEWIGPRSRPYAEVIDAWRTSCPRLPVWEEANARGLLVREHVAGVGTSISVSAAGLALLDEHLRGFGVGPATGPPNRDRPTRPSH